MVRSFFLVEVRSFDEGVPFISKTVLRISVSKGRRRRRSSASRRNEPFHVGRRGAVVRWGNRKGFQSHSFGKKKERSKNKNKNSQVCSCYLRSSGSFLHCSTVVSVGPSTTYRVFSEVFGPDVSFVGRWVSGLTLKKDEDLEVWGV